MFCFVETVPDPEPPVNLATAPPPCTPNGNTLLNNFHNTVPDIFQH